MVPKLPKNALIIFAVFARTAAPIETQQPAVVWKCTPIEKNTMTASSTVPYATPNAGTLKDATTPKVRR